MMLKNRQQQQQHQQQSYCVSFVLLLLSYISTNVQSFTVTKVSFHSNSNTNNGLRLISNSNKQHQSLLTPSFFGLSSYSNNGIIRTKQDRIVPSVVSLSSTNAPSAEKHYSQSRNKELLPGILAIDTTIDILHNKLSELRDTSLYFRLFSVDILGSCEYMSQELIECYTEKCEIYPEDDDAIPDSLRTIDQEEGDNTFELDGWSRWDMPSNDYYDTSAFPEGSTGYDGSSVWKFIHEKIGFIDYKYDDDHWKADFNKAVSGLHSIISAQVARGIRDKIEDGDSFAPDEVWLDPVVEYNRRLRPGGETPLAIENLYFICMVLLGAINRVKDRYLSEYDAGTIDDDEGLLSEILSLPVLSDKSITIVSNKLQQHAVASNTELWQARMRSRDLLRIMNCVQCNKCRFHGKISVMGLITAFKVLIGPDGTGADTTKLLRVELAALVTALHKCTTAIQFCREMQQQQDEQDELE